MARSFLSGGSRRRDVDGVDERVVPIGRNHALDEVKELGREDRVARERRQAERATVPEHDPIEAHVHQLSLEHWLRQCAGQSRRKRRGIPLDLLRQRLGQHEIGERQPPSRPQDATHLGERPALPCR